MLPLEVLGGSQTKRTARTADEALQALDRNAVVQVAPGRRVVLDGRDLSLRHNLKAMDALHLASAAAGAADAFLTTDRQLLALGSHSGVPIVEPQWHGDFPLEFLPE